MGLKYGGKTIADYSAMIGPCSDGFHVPSKDEWGAVKDIWVSLGGGSTDGTNFGKYLKLPLGGARNKTTSAVGNRGTMGDYRSVDAYDFDKGYHLYLHASYLSPDAKNVKTYGMFIRPFKDSPITPTSSWTKLYGTSIEAGGIFWSSTDGLISLSSNGQTWITISDKNIGATQARNNGDTLSEANSGKYFQRGNNYGFSFSGNVTTSSTRVNATNYGPGNYYSSSTYITYDGSWDSSYNNNLRGGETGVKQNPTQIVKRYYGGKLVADYSAMRGPCSLGFHVPSEDEWQELYGILIDIFSMTQDSTTMGTYLKMPRAGCRMYTSSNIDSLGSEGKYWTSTAYSSGSVVILSFNYGTINPRNRDYAANGFSIRGFKDIPTIPTSSWTTLYDGSSVATGAGVFRNSSLGLISLSGDGTTWYTIQDKNLGATTVFNQGDTLTDANCGYFYQWGNNYGFSHSGTITTSSTQVDASTYGPGNYYYSDTFITMRSNWSSVPNNNLWGGVTGVQRRYVQIAKRYYGGKMVDDYSAMQGPAPDGFHVPMYDEFNGVKTYLETLGLTAYQYATTLLKLPPCGYRDRSDGDMTNQGTRGYYWTCSKGSITYLSRAYCVRSSSTSFSQTNRGYGYSIRPFKDEPVIPDSSWTVEYQGTGTAGIYSNSTLGLISISSDGNNWTTIADKNLGATTVYNTSDTLSEANCGKLYQRGNNYGFPYSGTITTSSTQVDASNYGPGNYYSSSTFITASDWTSVRNDNLRGGETGVQQRPTLIREKS